MSKNVIFIGLLIVALVVGYLIWNGSLGNKGKPAADKAMVVKTHSDAFNNAVDSILNQYLLVKDAFVEADTAAVKTATVRFINALNALDMTELNKDKKAVFATAQASVNDVKLNAESLLKQNNITEMRKDFSMMTDMMYPSFFKSINYEGTLLYLQNCPMAFDGDKGANWLSAEAAILNPYLGKNDPTYKAGMLRCGEVKDSVGFK